MAGHLGGRRCGSMFSTWQDFLAGLCLGSVPVSLISFKTHCIVKNFWHQELLAHGVAVPQHVVLADRRGEGGDQDGDDNHDQQGDFKISFLGDLVVNVLYIIYILLYIYRNIVYRYRLFPL